MCAAVCSVETLPVFERKGDSARAEDEIPFHDDLGMEDCCHARAFWMQNPRLGIFWKV